MRFFPLSLDLADGDEAESVLEKEVSNPAGRMKVLGSSADGVFAVDKEVYYYLA
jgi:hypothetical protein